MEPREGDPFVVHDVDVAKLFANGEAVFLITEHPPGDVPEPDGPVLHPPGYQRSIRITKHDYEKVLYRHKYTPLLYIAPLHARIAYLYDCLNREMRQSRTRTFVMWWRRLGTTEWRRWFTVLPYLDPIYEDSLDPVYE